MRCEAPCCDPLLQMLVADRLAKMWSRADRRVAGLPVSHRSEMYVSHEAI
jgi:hypothetical protein